LESTISHSVQVPCFLALRASSVYWGSGEEIAVGAEIPPPTRYTPPPIPPPLPAPTPGPWPTPTPPPDPEPIPPPAPVPLEGGAEGMTALVVVPRVGMWFSATCTAGGATTVGCTASLGWGLRITIAGGVICGSRVALGRCPLGAGRGSRSPPPPPPLTTFLETGSAYDSGEGAIRVTTWRCWRTVI